MKIKFILLGMGSGLLLVVLIFGAIAYSNSLEIERIKAQEEKEINVIEARKQEEIERQLSIDLCLANAYTDYSNMWAKACEEMELRDDCSLPKYTYERLDELHKNKKDECFKRY